VNWSGELGFGVRPPERGQATVDSDDIVPENQDRH
jgi:hypothetical protein